MALSLNRRWHEYTGLAAEEVYGAEGEDRVDERLAYLGGEPADDERFLDAFAHELELTGGHAPPEATRVARTLPPDILPYDPRRPTSFPHNGRTDDVVDVFLSVLTNGRVTGDKVGPHGDLLDEFPYLGPPHG